MSWTPEEIKAAGLDDFRVFLIEMWAYLGLPRPTRIQLDIAYWLQHGPRRAILQAFRGVGKSWITAAFVLWTLFLDPQKKIMVVSASQQLADDFSKFCLSVIRGWALLHHLAPREGQRASGISFDVGPATPSKDPSLKSVGITGQLTGSRADIIIPDDVEIPKNVLTHLMRERLAKLVTEFDAILKPLDTSRVLYLGTPQIEDTLYRKLDGSDGGEGRGYVTQIWPAEIPANPDVYRGRLAPIIMRRIAKGAKPGEPVDPERFNKVDLMERRASYGAAGYALQFMLDTSPANADRHPLKVRDFIVHECDETMGHVKLVWGDAVLDDLACHGLQGDLYRASVWRSQEMAPYTGTVMAIDPSGKGRDETAYAIIKYLHGMLYLMDVGGFTDGYGEETLKRLAGKALRWKVNDIIAETNYGGGMFNELLKPHLIRVGQGRFDEEWKGWSRGMKEQRMADTLAPVLASHRLVVNRTVIEDDLRQAEANRDYSFIYQLSRLTRDKGALAHDDRLDAVAMAVSYWTEKMNRDADRAVEHHRDAALDAELRKFRKHVLGVNPKGASRKLWSGRR